MRKTRHGISAPARKMERTCKLIKSREYLVNPFLFMTATLVEPDQQENGSYKPIQGVQIIGQNVSSLHRLRDINNKGEYCGGVFSRIGKKRLTSPVRWRILRIWRHIVSQTGKLSHAIQFV